MADQPSTTDTSAGDASKTLRVPVCVAAASFTAIIAWVLAFAAAASGMSIQSVVVFAAAATVAGCGVLAAIVVVCCRSACRKLQAVLTAKFAAQIELLTDDLSASCAALRIEMLEQHKQTRVAHFAVTPADAAAGGASHLRPV